MKITCQLQFAVAPDPAAEIAVFASPSSRPRTRVQLKPEKALVYTGEDKAFESWKQAWIIVQMGKVAITSGPFEREDWSHLEVAVGAGHQHKSDQPKPEPDPVEPPPATIVRLAKLTVRGLLRDRGEEPDFSDWKVVGGYSVNRAEGPVPRDSISSPSADGAFELVLGGEEESWLEDSSALRLSVIGAEGAARTVECLLTGGGAEVARPVPRIDELGRGETRPVSAQAQPENGAATTVWLEATAARQVELRMRPASAIAQPVQLDGAAPRKPVRLRGRVVNRDGSALPSRVQVIFQGVSHNAPPESSASALAVTQTDSSGQFSIDGPMGSFRVAKAVVSVQPDQAYEITLNEAGRFPDFVWIVLEGYQPVADAASPHDHVGDDCRCKSGGRNAPPTRPDMEDLVNDDSFAEDASGQCTNFTTPNRVLEEFPYRVVIRTSDPQLFPVDREGIQLRLVEVEKRILFLQRQLAGVTLPPSGLALAQSVHFNPSSQPDANATTTRSASRAVAATAAGRRTELKQTTAIRQAVQAPELIQRVVNNPAITAVERELATLRAERARLQRLQLRTGRVPLDGNTPIDWDDSDGTLGVVQASTIAHGHLLHFKQVWRAAGYSLGDLVYSLPLAPGQKKQIAVFDWERRESARQDTALDATDDMLASSSHDRDILDIVKSSLSENQSGKSHSRTEGSSMGIGAGTGTASSGAAAGSWGPVSAIGSAVGMIGFSGGANKSSGESWNESSQQNLRNLSASAEQKIRESTMQSASSVRSQRSSVVTTVTQGESFRVTTEVVANHNHCHALTIQYFEVLRHYALYQELSDVQECLFIPLLIERFNEAKVLRWGDILIANLIGPRGKLPTYRRGFDAVRRKVAAATDPDAYSIFPAARYADDNLTEVFGELEAELTIARPDAMIPRVDAEDLAQRRERLRRAMSQSGLSNWLPNYQQILEQVINAADEQIETAFQQQLAWANAPAVFANGFEALVRTADGEQTLGLDATLFERHDLGVDQGRIGRYRIKVSLRNSGNLPQIKRADIKGIIIRNVRVLPQGSSCILRGAQLQYRTEHLGSSIVAANRVNDDVGSIEQLYFNSSTSSVVQIPPSPADKQAFFSTPLSALELRNPRREDIQAAEELMDHLHSFREHYHARIWMNLDEQRLFNLLDRYQIEIPRLRYAQVVHQGELIEGLVLDDDNNPVIDTETRSVASVVELRRMGVVGNSVVFPVARGLNVNRDFLMVPELDELTGVTIPDAQAWQMEALTRPPGVVMPSFKRKRFTRFGAIRPGIRRNLLDLYKPLPGTDQEPKPFRISVPTKGLFAEAVPGACNSCEKIDDSRFWKWEEHPIDEPTAIQPIATDSRRSDTADQLKTPQFSQPIIAMQSPSALPDPQGIATALTLMGKSDIFRDITGLDQNQKNALQAMLSNQESAQFFAEKAAQLAIEAGQQAQHAADTVANYDLAKGKQKLDVLDKIKDLPVDADTKKKYLDSAVEGLLTGDDKTADTLRQAATKNQAGATDSKPITSQESLDRHAEQGRNVEASRNGEFVKISSLGQPGAGQAGGGAAGGGAGGAGTSGITAWSGVPALTQANPNACWATAATMLMSWKRKQSLDVETVLGEAGQAYLAKFRAGQPLLSSEKDAFVAALGMTGSEPAGHAKEYFVGLLRNYGPLWVTTDAKRAEGAFSPHARILIKVVQGEDAAGADTQMTYLDPADGRTVTETFPEFYQAYEQMVTDNPSKDLFVQIVRFTTPAAAGGTTGEGSPGLEPLNYQVDIETIQAFAAEADLLRRSIYEANFTAIQNFETTLRSASPEDAEADYGSAILNSVLSSALSGIQKDVEKVLKPTQAAGAVGLIVNVGKAAYEEMKRAEKSAAGLAEGRWINDTRALLTDAMSKSTFGRDITDDLIKQYHGMDEGRRLWFVSGIQLDTEQMRVHRSSGGIKVRAFEAALYCSWINQHFNNDAASGTGFIELKLDSDGRAASAHVKAPKAPQIEGALNVIMSEAGIFKLMDLFVVKSVTDGMVRVAFECDNRLRIDTFKPEGARLKSPETLKAFTRFGDLT